MVHRLLSYIIIGSLGAQALPLFGFQRVSQAFRPSSMAYRFKAALTQARPRAHAISPHSAPRTPLKPVPTVKIIPRKPVSASETPMASPWWQRFSAWLKSGFQRVMSRTAVATGGIAGAVTLTAPETSDKSIPFTKEAIDAHPELKDQFAQLVEKNIYSQDATIIETILYFLDRYPEMAGSIGFSVLSHLDTSFDQIHEPIFVHLTQGIMQDQKICTKFTSYIENELRHSFDSYPQWHNFKPVHIKNLNRLFFHIPQACEAATNLMIGRLKLGRAYSDYRYTRAAIHEFLYFFQHFTATTSLFLKRSFEEDNDYVWSLFYEDKRFIARVSDYLKLNPDADFAITPKNFNAVSNALLYNCTNIYDMWGFKKLQEPAQALFKILLKNLFRPEIFSNLDSLNAISYCSNDPQLTQEIAQKVIELGIPQHALEHIFKYPGSYNASHEYLSDYVTKGRYLKDVIIAHIYEHPDVLNKIPLDRATYLYSHMHPTPPLTSSIKNRITSPEEFKKVPSSVLITIVRQHPEVSDTFIQFAVQTNNTTLKNILQNPSQWAHPESCDQHRTYIKDQIIKKILELGLDNILFENIDEIYSHVSDEEQVKLENYIKQKLSLNNDLTRLTPIERAILFQSSMLGKCTKNNFGQTQSEHHYCNNQDGVISQLKKVQNKITGETRMMLFAMLKKEREETEKGNYVMYHAQRWPWLFKSDMYKSFMKLTQPEKVAEDYQFLRFGNNREHNDFYIRDALFMNGALFGNSHNSGSCSFTYFLENHDFSNGRDIKFSTKWMAEQFKLEPYYVRHKQEFDELEILHNAATQQGNFLLISIPKEKVDEWVYPSDGSARLNSVPIETNLITSTVTTSTKYVLDAVKSDALKKSNFIQYAMPMEGEVLDATKGPRMYAFNNADKEIMADYCTKRDALFATIKQEIEKEKAS